MPLTYLLCYVLLLSTVSGQLIDLLQELNTPEQDVNDILKEDFDFVIVGGGTAGCVLANRLTENPRWRVLLLEAGREESFLTDIPLVAAMTTLTDYNWGYKSTKNDHSCLDLEQGRCNLPRGKVLGGTSVLNFLLYTRGSSRDFDDWEASGNKNWSYKSVQPYFFKSENCTKCKNIETKFHGFEGNLHIETPSYETELVKHFLDAGQELGYKTTDPNGERLLGFSRVQAMMKNGRRHSASKAFLQPIRHRKNLRVLTKARVTKILLKNKRAIGVEFMKNGVHYKVKIKKEVLLSAGSFNSPQILMLSGIGPKEHLETHKIPVIQNLKVGYNLQDHTSLASLIFLVNKSITISDTRLQNLRDLTNYFFNGDGPYTIPGGAEALAFLNFNNTNAVYPDIEVVLGAGALNGDTYGSLRHLLGIPDGFYEKICEPVRRRDGFSMTVVLMRPKSRGRVTLKNSNPTSWPNIDTNYFDDDDDVERMVLGIKKVLEISKTESFQKIGTTLHDTPYPGCEDISFASDDYCRCIVRHYGSTLGHQVGTCKMGPRQDPEAVVDDKLKVHGIGNLRVVDGSIMPNVIAGHPTSAIIMIAEKGSDMIKDDWDL